MSSAPSGTYLFLLWLSSDDPDVAAAIIHRYRDSANVGTASDDFGMVGQWNPATQTFGAAKASRCIVAQLIGDVSCP